MDFRSFRPMGDGGKSQSMFKALRRLHGQNLETRGLHDMTEAFQSFVTRARFFSIGKLRRTWSHSAAEFVKYRRLLPMLLADGAVFDNHETDDFDASLAFQAASWDEKKVVVTNISPRATSSQLQSYFSQFGKIKSCSLPREERKSSIFGTLPKHSRNCGTANITFKTTEGAEKAKNATAEELKFYDQVMVVSAYVSRKRGGKGFVLSDDGSRDEGSLSRASSTQSLASNSAMTASGHECFPLDNLPQKVLERVVSYLPIHDTIRIERVNKKFMEVSIKSWENVNKIILAKECGGVRGFNKQRPLRNVHLKAILTRAGNHLKSLDLSGIVHILDDKALDVIANCCPNLIEIDISGLHARGEGLQELGENLRKLQRLSYAGMEVTGDKAFWFLFKSCGSSLKFVDLRGAKRLHGRAFRLLGSQLEQLYLDGCSKVDTMAFEDLCTSAAGLKELRINECYRITDENLSMISRRMSELNVLTLCGDGFSSLSKAGLVHISHMSSITELALDYNTLVGDELLQCVAKGLTHLSSLSLANAGNDQSITSKGIEALVSLSELNQLDLSSIAAVKSDVLLKLAAACPKLELLQLRNCTYLSDDGIVGLKSNLSLRHVDLSGSILISNAGVQAFIKNFPIQNKLPSVTLVVGGTAADASKLSIRGSRVIVDFSDYSTLISIPPAQPSTFRIGSSSDTEDVNSDDDFETLTAQRSFYIDSVCGEDESPLEDSKELLEWAEKEARNLGLIKD